MSSVYAEKFTNGFVCLVGTTKERKHFISCNYQPGDKVRYEWRNGEIRSGTISHIDCAVNINDSVTGKSRSVTLADVIGYDNWLL